MTWNPYGTSGDHPSSPPGEGPGDSQASPSSWSAQQGSGYRHHGQNTHGQNTHGQSGYGQSGYEPTSAGAHYLPGSPARTSPGTNSVQRPGLRALAVFLVLGSLVYLGWHAGVWGEPLLDSMMLENCPNPDERMTCVTSDAVHRWLYTPMLAVLVAWGFASGAATEARNGRARGYVHLLCGIAALVVGGLVSTL